MNIWLWVAIPYIPATIIMLILWMDYHARLRVKHPMSAGEKQVYQTLYLKMFLGIPGLVLLFLGLAQTPQLSGWYLFALALLFLACIFLMPSPGCTMRRK